MLAVQISEVVHMFLIIAGIWQNDTDKTEPSLES